MNQGQQGAVSFTQPIKMPLSSMMKGKGRGSLGTPPLSSMAVPWSGEGSDLAPSVTPEGLESGATDVTVPSENPATVGEAVSKGVTALTAPLGGVISMGKAAYKGIKGDYSKDNPDFISTLVNYLIDSITGTGKGGQVPNTEGEVLGLNPANMHGQAAIDSGQVAPVPGGLTPSSEGDTEGYGGGHW